MMKKFLVIVIAIATLVVSGCQKLNQVFGLERNTPDEYDTLDLPPLTLPPDYKKLPKPEEVQKSRARERAKAALLKSKSDTQVSKSEEYLLKQAGVEKNDPKIRSKLQKEHDKFIKENTSVLSDYVPYSNNVDVLDAEAEKKRLEALEKKVTDLEKRSRRRNEHNE